MEGLRGSNQRSGKQPCGEYIESKKALAVKAHGLDGIRIEWEWGNKKAGAGGGGRGEGIGNKSGVVAETEDKRSSRLITASGILPASGTGGHHLQRDQRIKPTTPYHYCGVRKTTVSICFNTAVHPPHLGSLPGSPQLS